MIDYFVWSRFSLYTQITIEQLYIFCPVILPCIGYFKAQINNEDQN